MVYGILFAWAWLAALAADRGAAPRRVAGAAVALAALTLAALRGYSMDYDGYIELFDAMVLFDFPYPERLFLAKEPLMSLLIDGILWLQAGPQLMFVVMALLAIAMKHEVFSRVFRGDTAAAWAVTLSLHFFLHEFTQSRVAVAIAACFLALLAALEGRRKAWLGWCLFGFGWHVSALLFMTVSTALWLPRRWRVVGYAAGTAVIGALMLLAFEWVGSIDLRVGEYEGGAGVSGLMIAVIALKLAMLALMAHWLRHAPVGSALASLVGPTLALVVCGLVMLLVLREVSSVIAFRFYEFFDAFSVFIVTGALLLRRPLPVVTALAYCVLGIVLQVLPDLFKDFVLAPWSSYVG
jgi:hypothetical protein